jgi:hypothetical protein
MIINENAARIQVDATEQQIVHVAEEDRVADKMCLRTNLNLSAASKAPCRELCQNQCERLT